MFDERVESGADFAESWLGYREQSLPCHEGILWPRLLDHLGDLAGLDVADIGGGDGSFASVLLTQNLKSLHVIDINPVLISFVHAIGDPRLATYVGDVVVGLPFDGESLDRISCSCVLMHLNDAELAHFLAETHRVLRPNGRAVLAVVHEDWSSGYGGSRLDDATTLYERTMGSSVVREYHRRGDRLQEMCAASGLAFVSRESVPIRSVPGLTGRYSDNIGQRLYEIIVVQKAGESGGEAITPASA